MTQYGPEGISSAVTARLCERDVNADDSWREAPEPPSRSFDRPQYSEKRQDDANRSKTVRDAFSRAATTEVRREKVTPSAPPVPILTPVGATTCARPGITLN